MNVKDVNNVEEVPADIIKAIFTRQTELMHKYKEIEKLPEWPLEIDDKKAQVILKDFMWRFTEEICEALEAEALGHMDHYYEELIDALHFITELLILSGIEVYPIPENHKIDSWDIPLVLVGLAGNCLKNKAWKQTPQLTDKEKYKAILQKAYHDYIGFLQKTLTREEIYNYYFKKSEVNKFRQRSQY